MTVEIVLLAMVAFFVGLRLYAVLGRRTGHEQQPVTRPETVPGPDSATPVAETAPERRDGGGMVFETGAANGIRAIVAADPDFDAGRFMEGAQAAYRMVLEAYWKGDRDTLSDMVSDEVRAPFMAAIDAREAEGVTLDNRLIRIDRAMIEHAELEGRDASIRVRFDADIAAITRNKDGEAIAGTMTDAVETHDIWTFRRALGSNDPNWLLVETDEG